MSNSIIHSVILAIVDRGNGDDVMKTAKATGAIGSIVIDAQGVDLDDTANLSEITVQTEKEMVAILATSDSENDIMNTINNSFGIDSPAHGTTLSFCVSGVLGLDGFYDTKNRSV